MDILETIQNPIYPDKSEQDCISGFIEAFYFADTGDDCGIDSESDLSDQAMRQISIDCLAFIGRYRVYLDTAKVTASYEQIGHDFYFTRQGHGTGFWDRDPELYGPYQTMLDNGARSFGELYLEQGDSGLIYC